MKMCANTVNKIRGEIKTFKYGISSISEWFNRSVYDIILDGVSRTDFIHQDVMKYGIELEHLHGELRVLTQKQRIWYVILTFYSCAPNGIRATYVAFWWNIVDTQ
jgi:hypothetical protein